MMDDPPWLISCLFGIVGETMVMNQILHSTCRLILYDGWQRPALDQMGVFSMVFSIPQESETKS